MAQITLNSSGVASNGALVLQSNGTTTAVTISTAQVATLEKDAVVNGITVGRGAGAVATNTAVGASALAANTTGAQNTSVGFGALGAVTTGARNTAIGYLAGNVNTGDYNTAMGWSALSLNTSGELNTAIGDGALQSNTTGGQNSSVGQGSLTLNTTGSFNTALGRQALRSNTTASNNTAVGYQAGYSNQTGLRNTFIGATAGYTCTTPDGDTHIGYGAGFNQTTGLGNTFVGGRAGGLGANLAAGFNVTTGTYNTFIGGSAGSNITTGSKNSILGNYNGNQGGLDIRTLSNHIVLSDGDGNPRQVFNGSGHLFFYTMASGAGTNALRFSTSTGAVTYDTSSARYKDNIRDSIYGLSHVMQMRSAQFEYKDTGRSDVGLIAEELDPIIPELVCKNKDGEPDSVSYDRMVSVLVKAIQELKAEFDAYKEAHP